MVVLDAHNLGDTLALDLILLESILEDLKLLVFYKAALLKVDICLTLVLVALCLAYALLCIEK